VHKIKAVVFGVRNLIIAEHADGRSGGVIDEHALAGFGRFIRYLRTVGIQPVVFQNDAWERSGDKASIIGILKQEWGDFPAFETTRDNMPRKPQAAAMQELLKRIGRSSNEVLYIGNSESDMQTAVNGRVLFLNGTWLKEAVNYGFKFATPKELAKFVDIFCVRQHDWHFKIEQGDLRYYAMAPFSTMLTQYEEYSASARAMAKRGVGNPEFWGRYLCSTLFLSGLHEEIDYVCPFPSHAANRWNDPLRQSLDIFAKCFRIRYLPDLLVRHTTALQSHKNRDEMSHASHLKTLELNRAPMKNLVTGERYRNPPLKSGKTVLIVDDFCTRGFSLEAGRALVEQTGAKVILLSWLKTINTPYVEFTGKLSGSPYVPCDVARSVLLAREHSYHATISDAAAYKELAEKHGEYDAWDWPAGC
jgi:hypothetical protein